MFASSDLRDLEILSLDDIGVTGDTEENGSTFEENSLIKAAVPASLGYIGIADDSGLCVDALGDAPGIYSARFSGENANDASNNRKLLDELSGISPEKRGARYVCVVSCVFPANFDPAPSIPSRYDVSGAFPSITGESRALCVRGECRGIILDVPRGSNGFGYDPLFYFPDHNKSFAELSHDEKNAVSHRGNAMREFARVLNDVLRGRSC